MKLDSNTSLSPTLHSQENDILQTRINEFHEVKQKPYNSDGGEPTALATADHSTPSSGGCTKIRHILIYIKNQRDYVPSKKYKKIGQIYT